MRNATLAILPLFLVAACKRTTEAVVPPIDNGKLEYRLINSSNQTLPVMALADDVAHPDMIWVGTDENLEYFNRNWKYNVPPGDTLRFERTLPNRNPIDLASLGRRFKVRVSFPTKVFSPLAYSRNFIVEGQPYAIGWTFGRYFQLPAYELVGQDQNRVRYINWPADTAVLEEVMF
ncbi:hypothetical protein [Flaviaesturariibacter amylovorans]|uniref:Uncharacterized protein n=1 Tax=Flaviaesturariibacter amylovorans TaxID=1084520 RepID=A0ABP8GT54_9BACT